MDAEAIEKEKKPSQRYTRGHDFLRGVLASERRRECVLRTGTRALRPHIEQATGMPMATLLFNSGDQVERDSTLDCVGAGQQGVSYSQQGKVTAWRPHSISHEMFFTYI